MLYCLYASPHYSVVMQSLDVQSTIMHKISRFGIWQNLRGRVRNAGSPKWESWKWWPLIEIIYLKHRTADRHDPWNMVLTKMRGYRVLIEYSIYIRTYMYRQNVGDYISWDLDTFVCHILTISLLFVLIYILSRHAVYYGMYLHYTCNTGDIIRN